MWQWLSDNGSAIGVLISFGTLVVWVTYLHILFLTFRRDQRSMILINRAAGFGPHSRCLIVNMSRQPLYVSSLIASLELDDGTVDVALTDLRNLPEDLGTDPRSMMGQGALTTGDWLDIGHFDELRAMLLRETPSLTGDERVHRLNLTVVALYASDSHPVGARRSFRFDHDHAGGSRVVPVTVNTTQLRSRRERQTLLETVERHM